MEEKDGSSHSFMVISEEKSHSWSPMLLGVSCAFFALRLLPELEMCDNKWSEMRTRMLKGSAHLLGLLVWIVKREVFIDGKFGLLKKLESADKEIVELKKRRSEDAKANEKVVRIFASREQSWFQDRKKLRQHIDTLMHELGVLKEKKDRSIFELSEKLEEAQALLLTKDELIYEAEQKRQETEEKLIKAATLAEELRKSVEIEVQHHSCEISKHNTAFIELVSSHRQLEAEMSRVLAQAESAKQELDLVLDQKEQLILGNQSLSVELVKMHKDLEQKNQILIAMLRKSKLDNAEKDMLLEEVKSSKAKTKQAELEIERWKAVSEYKHGRHLFKKILLKGTGTKRDVFSGREMVKTKDVMNYGNLRSPRTEAEKKYEIAMEQNHRHLNTGDAFAEQLKLKDERLEAFRCRLVSMELESKRFQSRIEVLDHDVTQLRQNNMRLEGMLLDREAELCSLKEQLVSHCSPKNPQKLNDNSCADNTVRSKLNAFKGKPGHKRQDMKAIVEEIPQAVKNAKVYETSAYEQFHDIVLTLESPTKEILEKNVTVSGTEGNVYSKDIPNAEMVTSVDISLSKKSNSTWKMDVYSLGILYKVKRLKHQLIVLERLTGKKECCATSNAHFGGKEFCALMSLLNKQADRYQTLQGKLDDLCKRMYENNNGDSTIARLEDETKRLEHFLEETFQLQRYIVATGQKLTLVQTKIASAFAGGAEITEMPENLDMKQFTDGIKTLIQEVQRGIEVRICRIIGELEGTLTSDGLQTSQK